MNEVKFTSTSIKVLKSLPGLSTSLYSENWKNYYSLGFDSHQYNNLNLISFCSFFCKLFQPFLPSTNLYFSFISFSTIPSLLDIYLVIFFCIPIYEIYVLLFFLLVCSTTKKMKKKKNYNKERQQKSVPMALSPFFLLFVCFICTKQ